MKKNIIINGINSESQILYEELLNHGLDDVVFIDSNKELVNNLNHKSQNLIAYSGNPTSPEFLESITESILNTAGVSLPIKLMDIQSKGTSVWSIKIPAGSSIIGKDISKLKFPFRAIILGKIDNKGNPFQSTENIDIEQDDTVLIISSNRNEESMTRFFQGKDNG